MDPSRRWILPDLASALTRAMERNRQKIRCTLALATEFARTEEEARAGLEQNTACIQEIAMNHASASVSVKLSTLGALGDKGTCRERIIRIAREAARSGVPLELDMEGKGTVDLTLEAAIACKKEGSSVMVALQAYLDRTREDLPRMVAGGIGIRLVKGAYLGDVSGFENIRERTENHARTLKDHGVPFSLGTHDPVLIGRIRDGFRERKNLVEFGFLMGLSDQTKIALALGGWRVSEYIPFGGGGDAYILRRERYLRELAASGRAPAR